EDAIELPGRDPSPPVLRDPRDRVEHAGDSAARPRRDVEKRRVGRKREALLDRMPELPGCLFPGTAGQIPLVRLHPHPLSRRRAPFPPPQPAGATAASGAATPSFGWRTGSATSDSSIRFLAETTERTSGPRSVLPLRRIPAVSTRRNRRPPCSRLTSTESRVV